MRKLFFILLFIVLVGRNQAYNSLEKAVQSQWKTPIEIINQDEDKQLVYYLDQTQHILGVYHYENGKSSYDNEQSVGMQFESEIGLLFLLSANHFESIGNIIHGAIKTNEYEVERFVIEYKNGKMQEVKSRNNTFITEFPLHLTVNPIDFLSKVENAYGYDKNNEIIESWS